MKRDIIYIISILVLLALSVIPMFDNGFLAANFGISNTSEWYTCVTYIFIHANPIHLLLNVIMFTQLGLFFANINFKVKRKYIIYIISLIVSILFAHLCSTEIPTIGASGFIFGIYGYVCSKLNLKSILFNVVNIIAYSFVGFVLGVFNYKLHIVCFLFMFVLGFIMTYERKRR